MANPPKQPDKGVEGEGSYNASRDYKKSIDRFMSEKSDQIDDLAQDAAKALDSDDEKAELKKAEKEGLKHGKH